MIDLTSFFRRGFARLRPAVSQIAVGDFVEATYERRKKFRGVVTEVRDTDCVVCCTDDKHVFYMTARNVPRNKVVELC